MIQEQKAFTLWGTIFLGIGSMVGAGIFIVIGQASAIAGNIVWLSFVFGALIAMLSSYSLAKLAITYQSRGGIVEYIVQGFGDNIFSGTMGVVFYLSQLIAVAAVAKSFGTYAATFMTQSTSVTINLFAVGIIVLFTVINLLGAALVAKSEKIIVFLKLGVLIIFAIAALFSIQPGLLSINKMPPMSGMVFAIGITFFAYQGFSVITNTVEDMQSPETTILKAMFYSILIVATLYILTSIAVLGNLPITQLMASKDYALAEAAKPIFGTWGFKIMSVTALLATASAINATLYAITEIGYTMAKEGNLPKVYAYRTFNSFEGLIVSTIIITPIIIFFDLSQITTIAAIVMLLVQGITHIAHLKLIKHSHANISIILLAIISMFSIAALTIYSTHSTMPKIVYYLSITFLLSFVVEFLLRLFANKRYSRP